MQKQKNSNSEGKRPKAGKRAYVRKTVLGNGLTVLTEKMAHVRSVSFGVFLNGGSRHEGEAQHGLSHFIEHALFKGTTRRTAAQIASESDVLGGNFDAFTGRDVVGYSNHVLDEHLPVAFELTADLVTSPAFDETELDKERNVILEEIKMTEDTPDDIVYDIFYESFYPGHPLGRPILGTPDTLSTFNSARVRAFYEESYRPERMIIAAAGNLEHDHLVELAREHFAGMVGGSGRLELERPDFSAPITPRHKPDLEQSHLVLGFPCPSAVSEDRYIVDLLTLILGGGMSSRLFQSVREERGLVYSIDASISAYIDCGFLSIYAGASTEQLVETIEAIMREIERIKTEPVGADELERNKNQLKTSFRLDQESSSSRMSWLAVNEMHFGRYIPPEEVIEQFEAVTPEGLQRIANQIFQPDKLALTVLGNLDGFSIDRSQLYC